MLSLAGDAVALNIGEGASVYPRANYLANGHILGAYTAFPPATGVQQLTLVTSTDQGASWHLTGTAATRPVNEASLDNPYPLQLPSGEILLAYRNHDKDEQNNWTTYRITISRSRDLGLTWEFLSEPVVIDARCSTNGAWEPFLRNTKDGTLELYYSQELKHDDQDNVLLVSADGGLTWHHEKPISGAQRKSSRDGMVGVVEVSEGSLLAVYESNDRGGCFSVYSSSSSNHGETWDDRRPVYIPPPGRNAGAPQVIKVGDTLVVSFMTDEDRAAIEDHETRSRNWPEIAAAKLLTSSDGGVTWDNKLTVFPIHADWPGLLALRDEEAFLYLAGYGGGVKAQKVVLS
ncbi:hypothetical protein BP6252_11179 [Coleophoma cylindrospora]|uniref:Sialidase domain-containing protein n=1 Tax=Coleophoma cylindrospora TaxID=1849047 RepID=A0A3D8QQ85_9HELO|nr:hypothetical protein BP6252_11179 [Coleophoma cylindrospora]